MSAEPRSTAVAVSTENSRSWPAVILQSGALLLQRSVDWAAGTAEQFGAMVGALMAPAVVSVYAVVAWALAANLGWTDSFIVKSGPLSNWMIWMGIAVLVTLAANVLRKRSRPDQ